MYEDGQEVIRFRRKEIFVVNINMCIYLKCIRLIILVLHYNCLSLFVFVVFKPG